MQPAHWDFKNSPGITPVQSRSSHTGLSRAWVHVYSCHRGGTEGCLWGQEGAWSLCSRDSQRTCWRQNRNVKRVKRRLQKLVNRSQGSICSIIAKIAKFSSRYKIKAKKKTAFTFWYDPTIDLPIPLPGGTDHLGIKRATALPPLPPSLQHLPWDGKKQKPG